MAPQSAQEVDLTAQLSQAPVTHAFFMLLGSTKGKACITKRYQYLPVASCMGLRCVV